VHRAGRLTHAGRVEEPHDVAVGTGGEAGVEHPIIAVGVACAQVDAAVFQSPPAGDVPSLVAPAVVHLGQDARGVAVRCHRLHSDPDRVDVVALLTLAAGATVGADLELLAPQRQRVEEGFHARGEGLRGIAAGNDLHGSLVYTLARYAASAHQDCTGHRHGHDRDALAPDVPPALRSHPTRLRSVVTCS